MPLGPQGVPTRTSNGATQASVTLFDADSTGTTLTANLTSAVLTRADLIDVKWPEGVQVPDRWVIDDESGYLRPAGRLSEITAHYPW